jgi:protein-disulfide isomerase
MAYWTLWNLWTVQKNKLMSLKPPVSEKDHQQGSASAHVELVEYGDYQCPHCGRAYPIIKKIQKRIGNKLRFVFRNFPLSEIHPEAVSAAVASEAASRQDKFWEMHDALFEHQEDLSAENIFRLAEKIGLNEIEFAKDIQRDDILKKVEDDFESGIRSGVNGTPTFFINGKKYTDSWDEKPFFDYLNKL